MNEVGDFLSVAVLASFGLMLFPLALVTMTGFIKIVIVLFVLRNATGLQQSPPNMVLNTIALVLVTFIHAPIVIEAYENIMEMGPDFTNQSLWLDMVKVGFAPFERFMMHFTEEADRAFFLDIGKDMYRHTNVALTDRSIFVLIPAFVVAELTAAFEIGVLIFLPFLAIDIVVTNLLTALGMNMMTPTVISLPFKLLLFVAVSGWSRITHALILSYLQV